MAVIALGQNLGMVLGPAMFGMLIDSAGWTIAGYAMIPVAVIGAIAALLSRVR